MVLWRRHVTPGFLGLATNSRGFVEGIGDRETLSADVPIPEGVRSPVIVAAGLVWVLDWQQCRCW